MYPIETFHIHDRAEMREFIEKYPFATLVVCNHDGDLVATHLPLMIEEWGEHVVFRGHVMRDSDHWHALQVSQKVLVSFLGPDAPILASWQKTKRFGGTWNYQALHAHGLVKARSQDVLLDHLARLKSYFETSAHHQFDSLPKDYVSAMLPMIECIDIHVSRIECLFKLSQNRCLEEFDSTIEHLQRAGGKSALVATEMQQRRPRYFPNATASKRL